MRQQAGPVSGRRPHAECAGHMSRTLGRAERRHPMHMDAVLVEVLSREVRVNKPCCWAA